MANQISEKTFALMNAVKPLNVGTLYRELTRGGTVETRAQHKIDREIVGTRSWAIDQCANMAYRNLSDEVCEQVAAVLGVTL